MEKGSIFEKVAKLEAEHKEAKQKFMMLQNSMEELVSDVENRLTGLRKADKIRISELEELLSNTPGEKIRKLDIDIQLESERVRNVNNDPYGAFRKELDDKKIERERLVKELQSSAATPEEIELAELRRKTYSVTDSEKDRIFEMYESSLTEIQKMRTIRSEMREALEQMQEAVKTVRSEIIGDTLLDLRDRHIDGIKEKFDGIEKRVML